MRTQCMTSLLWGLHFRGDFVFVGWFHRSIVGAACMALQPPSQSPPEGGGVEPESVFESVDTMLNVCLRPAITSSHVAASFLRPGGLLVLTGSDAALKPTPSMIG